jgi:hypothetical protein
MKTRTLSRRTLPFVAVAALAACGGASPNPPTAAPSQAPAPAPASAPTSAPAAGALPNEEHLETAKAVMVTVELDYGPAAPTIAQAIKDVERRSEAAGGGGRTFAILDAYGEQTPDGKLHMSMHVSAERPGRASLVWKRTGQVLWRAQIEGQPVDLASRKLGIIINDGKGRDHTIDGSNGPSSILDATVQDMKVPVRDYWPDGAEREVTFIYSACGCPVKAAVKRTGERTVRTKDLPVMFPDDPQAMAVITSLMKW